MNFLDKILSRHIGESEKVRPRFRSRFEVGESGFSNVNEPKEDMVYRNRAPEKEKLTDQSSAASKNDESASPRVNPKESRHNKDLLQSTQRQNEMTTDVVNEEESGRKDAGMYLHDLPMDRSLFADSRTPIEQRDGEMTSSSELLQPPSSKSDSIKSKSETMTRPTVNVTIGRIEVKGSTDHTPLKKQNSSVKQRPKMSLEDYFNKNNSVK